MTKRSDGQLTPHRERRPVPKKPFATKIDQSVLSRFKKLCQKRKLSMAVTLQRLMVDWTDENQTRFKT